MDQLFVDLIGRPHSSPKIITILAENFSILGHQAEFLKAVLAIPAVKRFPHSLKPVSCRLIQLGPLHSDLESTLMKDGRWIIDTLNEDSDSSKFCDQISGLIHPNVSPDQKSLIFVNDASRFLLSERSDILEQLKFLRLIDTWKRSQGHFVIVLFQQSKPASGSKFLRNLQQISDAYVATKLCKGCYMQSLWFQPVPTEKTLLPPLIETHYYTVKIGKSESFPNFLCFQDHVRVTKNHDPDVSDSLDPLSKQGDEHLTPEKTIEHLALNDDDDETATATSTLPYIRAQNPEKSRIFYYPDKDDDIDEDDPDEDLDI